MSASPTGLPDPSDLEALRILAAKYPFLFAGVDPRDQRTVGEVIDLYLENAADEIGAETFYTRRLDLARFSAHFGHFLIRECSPIHLKKWIMDQKSWKSANKRFSFNASVQRVMNWAVVNRIIRENTFRGVSLRDDRATGREMKPEELAAALRATDANFRRFLIALKLTGARPSELSGLRWPEIDFEKKVAIRRRHKTSKKTGKPRVLILSDSMVKLLHWLERERRREPAAAEQLRGILERQPNRCMKVKELARSMHELGFSYRQSFIARQALGVTIRRVKQQKDGHCRHCGQPCRKSVEIVRQRRRRKDGSFERRSRLEVGRRGLCRSCYNDRQVRDRYEKRAPWTGGFYVYELPEGAKAKPSPPEHDCVFSNGKGQPWNRHALCRKFSRLRKAIGLPATCKLYGLRHKFLTDGVRRGTNLKALATLAGHVSTKVLEATYCHIDGDADFLRSALNQALGSAGNNGRGTHCE
jgi:integrase